MYDHVRKPAATGLFCLCLMTMTLVPAGGASAQAAADNAAARTAPAAEGAEAAGGSEGGGLQEVVVTARRRTEQLQDVPLTVTAVTAGVIEDYNVENIADLTSFVPNMKISQDRATSSTINVYIRGVGQSDPLWGFQPGVGVYVDDVYLARPQAALLDVLDVDRLEVLSGPQGTLYGRNTIAGAIKYVTRDIDGPATLTASATGGNYDTRNFKFMGSLPVIPDHVYFGLSLADLRHDGYGEVVAQPGVAQPPQSPLGVALSDKDILVGRANLTITWGESSKLKLVADDILDNSNASGGQRLNDYLNGQVSVLSLPLLGIPALPIVTPNAPPLSNPFDMYDNMPADQDFFHRQGFSGTYTQNLTSALSLKIVGAYYEGHGDQFINFSQTAQNLFDVAGQYHDQQSSGEMQLTYTNELVKAVGGVFYMDSNACGVYNADIGTLPLLGIPALDTYITELVSGCDLTKSTAVYGDTAWKLTDQLNLDAGLRWTEDKITAQVFQQDYVGPPVEPGMIFGTPEQAPPGLISTGVVTDYTGERSFTHLDPRLGLDYHFSKNVMAYFTYSRGFKSGGFDMRGNAALTPSTTNGYDAEVANNYELGLKSTLLDNTLLLNLAVFYDPYTDAQIQLAEVTINAVGLPANVTYTTNAGKQINQGAELQSVWRPIRPLTVALNVGYLDSYYEHFVVPCDIFPTTPQITPGCTPGVASVDLSSSQSPLNAPHWTVSEYQSYSWDFGAGSLMARAGFDYRTYAKTATTINAWTATDQPGYAVVNAGLAFRSSDGHWRVSLDGQNLTNKYYRVAGYEFGPPPLASAPLYSFVGGVSEIGYYGPPRTWAVTLQYHF